MFCVECPCGKRTEVSAALAGASFRCDCGRMVAVPALSELRRCAAEGAVAKAEEDAFGPEEPVHEEEGPHVGPERVDPASVKIEHTTVGSIYRPAGKYADQCATAGCFMLVIATGMAIGVCGMIIEIAQGKLPVLAVLFVAAGGFILVRGVIPATIVTLGMGCGHGVYIRTTRNGIEYHMWPSFKLVCRWQDLRSIKKRVIPFGKEQGEEQDVLYASRAKTSGFGSIRGAPYVYEWKWDYVIVLSAFEGWPKGNLADDLRQNAPHLFAQEK